MKIVIELDDPTIRGMISEQLGKHVAMITREEVEKRTEQALATVLERATKVHLQELIKERVDVLIAKHLKPYGSVDAVIRSAAVDYIRANLK